VRNAARIFFVAAVVAAAVAVAASPGGAGAPGANTVTIVKHVVGTAPEGTVFAADLNCQSILGSGAAATPDVTFDATGSPLSNNTFNVPAGQRCTVTESETGGATSTSYACEITRGSSDQIGPPFLGNCTGDNEVTFTDVIGDAATVTITNTFTPAPTTTTQPPTIAPQAVQATPVFTG
jgi:hypothetical protein